MEKEFCGYPIIHTNLNKHYIEVVGSREDAIFVRDLWNDENKNNHPRIVALNPEKNDDNCFWVELL